MQRGLKVPSIAKRSSLAGAQVNTQVNTQPDPVIPKVDQNFGVASFHSLGKFLGLLVLSQSQVEIQCEYRMIPSSISCRSSPAQMDHPDLE
jgi:hypothetical protein